MFQPSNPPTGVAPLQTMQRIPQDKALPLTPTLQKTTKPATTIPKAVEAPTSVQTKTPEGFSAPTLERVTKAFSGPAAINAAVNTGALRPSWPDHTQAAHKIEITPKSTPIVEAAKRVEDPRGLFMVSCDILTLGVTNVNQTKLRQVVHGILTFDKVMCLPGKDATDKLINYTLEKILPSTLPTFLKAGIGLGTTGLKVTYPVAAHSPDIVAQIEINSTVNENLKYRLITIRRFKPDMITSLEL